MRRFLCTVVLAADFVRDGKLILTAGSPFWHSYRIAEETTQELADSVLAHPPEGMRREGLLSEVALKVLFEEFPPETASTPAKFLAMPRVEITRAGELEDAVCSFMEKMTGGSWYGDSFDFDKDSPLQVFDRFRGRPNYFVDVGTLEWSNMPFALLISVSDDRKYHKHQLIVLDRVLANRAVIHILEARSRAMVRETQEQIQEQRMEREECGDPEEQVLSEGTLHTPLILFDGHHLECVDGTIRAKIKIKE